jgi:hypothetical protein
MTHSLMTKALPLGCFTPHGRGPKAAPAGRSLWQGSAARVLVWGMVLLLQLMGVRAWSQDAVPGSTGAGAAAVRNVVLGILSYARWPVEPAELHVCVVAPTQFADDLLQGATQASGRVVQVQRVPLDSPLLGTDSCNVIYLGAASAAERQHLFAQLAGQPVLSISEQSDTCSTGSMFCLHVHGARVSFEVNLDSVARSGVRVHPSVLQLGRPGAGGPSS